MLRESEAKFCGVVNQPLVGIIMADLDPFKAVNDTYGHPAAKAAGRNRVNVNSGASGK